MPKNITLHEIAVIGGGPAGSAAAILLARAGRNVVLLEKESAPHNKVCGEFISWEATHYLNDLGINLPALGAQSINKLRLIDKDRVVEENLPFSAWTLSRRLLDEALLQKAEQAGVIVRRGVSVNGLSHHPHGWTLNMGQGSNLNAKSVFLASGKHDVRGLARNRSKPDGLIGFKMHFQLTSQQQDRLRDHVEIFLFDGGYVGLQPIEGGKANLCFLIKKDIYVSCGKNWIELLSWVTRRSRYLEEHLAGAKSLWQQPLTVYGIPYGFIYKPSLGFQNLFRLGDQMAVIPSFAGDGISIALHSAFLAARTYLSGLNSDEYYRQARYDFHGPVSNAQTVAAVVSSVLGRKIVFCLLYLLPGLMLTAINSLRLSGANILNPHEKETLQSVYIDKTNLKRASLRDPPSAFK